MRFFVATVSGEHVMLQMDGQPGQVMLQALCPDELGWRQLEAIQRAGAHELFVLPVERALA